MEKVIAASFAPRAGEVARIKAGRTA